MTPRKLVINNTFQFEPQIVTLLTIDICQTDISNLTPKLVLYKLTFSGGQ